MLELNLVQEFTRRLNAAGLRYLITGSVASTIYGEPRVTHDVDLILFIPTNQVKDLPRIFPSSEFYCPDAQTLLIERGRAQRGHFNLIHHASGFKADCYFAGEDPLHHWANENAKTLKIGEDIVVLAPPEYVILRKLEFYREGGSAKHLRDIQSILTNSHLKLDRAVLEEKIEALGLEQSWEHFKDQ